MESRVLYIFVTSGDPDVYINIIGYCIEHYKIANVVFLGIIKDKGQKAGVEKNLNELKERISKQLELLQDGRYLFKEQDTKQWTEKNIDIESHEKLRYARIASERKESMTIVYSELEDKISEFIRSNDCIFDVSGVRKNYLVDLYVLLLSKKIENIYAFELKLKGRTHDENELIHKLTLDSGDYEYINLSESNYTKGKVIKSKREEEKLQGKVSNFDKVLQMAASDFATTILSIYAFVVISSLAGLVAFVAHSDWGNIEPWAFIIFGTPFFGYILSLLIQLILKRELSLKPMSIFNWLKEYKLDRLSKF